MNGRRDEPATKEDLRWLEERLTARIDANAEKIEANAKGIESNARKIEANAEKIALNGKKIDANSEKIDSNAAKIDANTVRLDKLTVLVLENRERIDKMVTRDEFNRRMDEVMASLDTLTGFFPRLDGERVATIARIDRLEGEVKANKDEIKKIKTKLGMS